MPSKSLPSLILFSPLSAALDIDIFLGGWRFSCSPGHAHYVAEDDLELPDSPAFISLGLQICITTPDLFGGDQAQSTMYVG